MLSRPWSEQPRALPWPLGANSSTFAPRARRSNGNVIPLPVPAQDGLGIVRDFNRRRVLHFIRTNEPVSRAEVARQCGLQRSTISRIVEQLMHSGWLVQAPAGHLPIGRNPILYRLNEDRIIIGIDVRPSQTTLIAADPHGKVIVRNSIATPIRRETAVDVLLQAIGRVRIQCGRKSVMGIGISVPRRFESADGALPDGQWLWNEPRLAGTISAATGALVELESDANACAMGALWFDRMEHCDGLVVVAVSEGISTGILVAGQLMRGAGEFGHMCLDPSGPLCSCGRRGCWQAYASDLAALREYGCGDAISFRDLLRRADNGDERASRAIHSTAVHLGRGMRVILAGLAPERIIVLGDLTAAWNRFREVVEAHAAEGSPAGPRSIRIDPRGDFASARLRGAVALVLQREAGGILTPSHPNRIPVGY